MTDLNQDFARFIDALGVDEFAFADLAVASSYIQEEYGDTWQGYPRAVVVAVHFPRAVVDDLEKGPSHTYLAYYDIINAKINQACLQIANKLAKMEYKAYPIPASQRVSDDKLAGIFSHRLAAYLGGLGWIGKSCNLITEKNGPCLRLGTVLTDAPFLCGRPVANKCGNCTACLDACPPHAIKNQNWQENIAFEQRVDALACHNYLMEVRHTFGKRVCGRCLAACPYGKK